MSISLRVVIQKYKGVLAMNLIANWGAMGAIKKLVCSVFSMENRCNFGAKG